MQRFGGCPAGGRPVACKERGSVDTTLVFATQVAKIVLPRSTSPELSVEAPQFQCSVRLLILLYRELKREDPLAGFSIPREALAESTRSCEHVNDSDASVHACSCSLKRWSIIALHTIAIVRQSPLSTLWDSGVERRVPRLYWLLARLQRFSV